MKYYFLLQYRFIKRFLSEVGLNPLILCFLIGLGFVILSFYMLSKGPYVQYIYGSFPLVLTLTLTTNERNTFLRSCFPDNKYYLIRLLENVIIALPFVILLIVNGSLLTALVVLVLCCTFVFGKAVVRYRYVIPTPFRKRPYEFLSGFRRSFLLLLLMYLITGITVAVMNFNLGVFCLIIVHLVCVFFYADPVKHFYVWCFSMVPTRFLFEKLKTLITYTTLLTAPIVLVLLIAFQSKYQLLLFVQLLGYLSVIASMLSKYAYYPNKLPLPEVFIFVFALILPPLVVLLIPYYYVKSLGRLQRILK